MPPSNRDSTKKADWLCKSCTGWDGKPFRNYGHRTQCHRCHIHKGACFGKNVDSGPPRSGATLAEKQVLQREVDEKYAKKLKQKDVELARLREQLRSRQPPAAGVATGADGDAAEDDTEQDLQDLRDHIKALEKMPGGEILLAEKKAELDSALQKRRAAKPVRQQLRDLQYKLDRKEKMLQKREESELPGLRNAAERAKQALAEAEKDAKALENDIIELKAERERLWAVERAEGSVGAPSASAESTVDLPQADFGAALGRLATVVEALPRAYQAGNLETAYGGIMENLRALVELAPDGWRPRSEAGVEGSPSSKLVPAEDSDAEFPEDYRASAELELDQLVQEVGAEGEEDRYRIRNLVQEYVRKANSH